MKNLAGNEQATELVTKELERIGVNVVPREATTAEVPALVTGELHGFEFSRAWYYYTVKGDFPVEIAQHMWENDVIWKRDVRAAGHCGCPAPLDWADYFCRKTGKQLVSLEEWENCKGYAKNDESAMQEIGQRILDECVTDPDDDRKNPHKYRGVVTHFDIDSESGLVLFVRAIKQINEKIHTVQVLVENQVSETFVCHNEEDAATVFGAQIRECGVEPTATDLTRRYKHINHNGTNCSIQIVEAKRPYPTFEYVAGTDDED